MALLSSMVNKAPQITHLIIDAPLRMAGRAWREVSRAFTAAAADTPAGKQIGVKSLVVGSGSSLQRAGAGDAAGARVKRQQRIGVSTLWLVRKRLGISILVSGQGATGTESIASYFTDELGNAGENQGRGVSEGRMDHASVEALTISGHVESSRFSALAVELTIRDALDGGDVIVNERMVVE